MKKFKRIAAGAGVLLLVGMYLCTLIFALLDNPKTMLMFKFSIALSLIVPVLCYGIVLFTRLSDRNKPDSSDDN
ncbi:hypothetical protein [Coprococcus sp. AF21-14LB]|uniref:hypothetical protein n=1 Tax=Coprococcus sp. AF21-14LB TaxID=2292231 RepID=UPI000E4E8FA1|nr:hypothetical protein [Coprococcus sp. AF21-14LB]RGS76095.1 hypothetical protein DWX73_12535 [Coprococcus sp. AF21-14LB]